VVVVNYPFEHPNVSQVMVDNLEGAKLAVDFLVSKGHTAIGMLTGVKDPSRDNVRRIQGFRGALHAQNIPVVDEWIISGNAPTYDCGYQDAQHLLTQHPQVTAIFAYNDLLALGALQACRELGRRVPEDVAVIGFDDIMWAAKSTPALTTVRVDKYDLGRQTTCRLFDMLDKPDTTHPPIFVNVKLCMRESA
jgi:LacI family transcriptional regulator